MDDGHDDIQRSTKGSLQGHGLIGFTDECIPVLVTSHVTEGAYGPMPTQKLV